VVRFLGGGGNFYITVSRSILPPVQQAWAVTNVVKLPDPGPTTYLVLMFFNDADIC
jgi:hypothetical protein